MKQSWDACLGEPLLAQEFLLDRFPVTPCLFRHGSLQVSGISFFYGIMRSFYTQQLVQLPGLRLLLPFLLAAVDVPAEPEQGVTQLRRHFLQPAHLIL